MFSSPKPPFSFLNCLAPTFSFTSCCSTSSVTQILPLFSTAGKLFDAQQRLQLHSSYAVTSRFPVYPGWGSPVPTQRSLPIPFRFLLSCPHPAPLTPLEATLTQISAAVDSKSLTEPLSRFYATFTKTGGWVPLLSALSQRTLRLRVIFFYAPTCALFPSPLLTSLPLCFLTSHFRTSSSRSSPNETHSHPLASHHMHAIPCGGSSKNQTIEIENGGDCA